MSCLRRTYVHTRAPKSYVNDFFRLCVWVPGCLCASVSNVAVGIIRLRTTDSSPILTTISILVTGYLIRVLPFHNSLGPYQWQILRTKGLLSLPLRNFRTSYSSPLTSTQARQWARKKTRQEASKQRWSLFVCLVIRAQSGLSSVVSSYPDHKPVTLLSLD